MKTRLAAVMLILWGGTAFAGPPSLTGGRQMPVGFAHQVGVGWPSVFYEYWRSGTPDWGIGGEIVYGDWSGEFSDMKVAGAVNAAVRWQLKKSGATNIAFQIKPGLLMGSIEAGRNDSFVFGLRSEFSIPV